MKNQGQRKLLWVAAIVLLSFLFVAFAANAGSLLVIDAPAPSDLIVVLAGETDRRPVRALELLAQGYGSRVILDVPAAAKIYDFTQVELAQKYVDSLPQAAAVHVCAIEGLSTRDESHDVEKCLEDEPQTRILIVTSDFHTRRALAIFRHEMPGKSFTVAAARDNATFGTRWWTHRQWAKTCVDEWLRVAWWNAVDRWR